MQRAARSAVWALPARFFRAGAPVLAADKESLLQLRRRTGLPILQCRDALQRCGGDLAQLSCETDFVARTTEFQRVVAQAALGAMELCRRAPPAARACSQHFLQPEELAELRTGPGGGPLSEELALAQGRLGEAVSLRHAAWLRVRPGAGFVSGYAHGGPAADPGAGPVALGTLGALVACGARGVARGGARGAALEALGRQVAQHVVGFAPRRVGRARERRRGGKEEEEEEEALLAQEFLHAPGRRVGRVLRALGPLCVTGFVRFRCGEEPTGDVTSR
ncbi:elongation factor Ts, mitochondrial isoform X3 [Neopsephotus bourkii]|uniref:elongation factor Ts, mitochondrial isoform X3 n=1 Tax=Neopsephotus bourkii TaxID=309878 RepID=UPI002AA500ED|nr:elongation factor Ts, mitochondrial isoform X3 [Neopsephotus bourkii]